jgi:putative serine protease XkdF
MKKERSFRPPQAVLDTVKGFSGDPKIVKLGTDAVPLSNLRRIHAYLRNQEMIEKGDSWDHQGGNAALMWSRRVLRQEGIIKASGVGDVFIPEVIDIQLGPNIVMGFTKEDPSIVASKFEQAGVPASLIPSDGGTYAFYSGSPQESCSVAKDMPKLPEVKLDDITMIDDSRNKLSSIFKVARDNMTGIQCQHLEVTQTPIDTAWESMFMLKSTDSQGRSARVMKVDEGLGLVIGWAIICTVEDEPYFDKQGDYLPDSAMLEASTDFMLNSRVAKEMHVGDEKGTVVFAWPMTAEIAKAFDIEVNQTGLMIAMKPDNEEMLEKFRDGTYNGFSIGGKRLADYTEEVE